MQMIYRVIVVLDGNGSGDPSARRGTRPFFPCLPSRGQLIGVIYKSKPGNLGIRDPPGGQ